MPEDPALVLTGEILAHAADDVGGDDDAVARRGFVDVHDAFADFPELHEQAFKAEGVREKAEPQQMAVHPVEFRPDDAQVGGAARHFDVHEVFDGAAEAQGVDAGADAADAFHDVDHLVVVAERGERFKSAVDVAELGQGFDHGFVVHDKLEMDRFRQNRMLRSERNDRTGHDALPTFW